MFMYLFKKKLYAITVLKITIIAALIYFSLYLQLAYSLRCVVLNWDAFKYQS